MTSTDIQKKLNTLFFNYEYKLQNSFVFDWECDFFCMSKSGYFVEVEIKISRSDFFKDFEKPKHKIFRDLVAGKKISVYTTGYNDRGDIAVKNFPHIRVECRGHRGTFYGRDKIKQIVNGSEELVEHDWSNRNGNRYIVNDWQGRLEICKRYTRDLYYPATSIQYHQLDNIFIPNSIYYAVPEGLIKPTELPPYAGLIEISHHARQIKKAPYMHKRKMDMDKILLRKFYNLWKYKGRWTDEKERSSTA